MAFQRLSRGLPTPIFANETNTRQELSRGILLDETAIANVNASINGVAGAGAVGSPTISSSSNLSLTGVAATSAHGSLSTRTDASVTLSGVAAAGVAGSPAISSSSSLSLTGVAATGVAGAPSIGSSSNITLTGVASTATYGSLTTKTSITLSGVASTAAYGSLSTSSSTSLTLTGVASTTAHGSLSVFSGNNAVMVGVAAACAVGPIECNSSTLALVAIAGQSASCEVGQPFIEVDVPMNFAATGFAGMGVGASFSVGMVSPGIPLEAFPIIGVGAAFSTGNLVTTTFETTAISGVASTCEVGTVGCIQYQPGFYMADLFCEAVTHIDQNPQVNLRWSPTRGQSWLNPVAQPFAVGPASNLQWRRLGMARGMVFELSWSTNIPTTLSGAFVDVVESGT